jgi:Ser/Thr protein kinase RdoA (MazF antagonist)
MTGGHPNHRAPASLPVELRRTTVPPGVRAWVARSTGAEVIRSRRLPGASSSAIHRLALGDGRAVVLRRYVWPGFLEDEPIAPQREVDMLTFAAGQRLPVPALVAADITGHEVGDGVPVVLMSFVPGRAVAVPDLEALAAVAAAIHAVEPSPEEVGHQYVPWYTSTTSGPPALATDPAMWERALTIWHDEMPPYRPALIHRDFHPGNVLWSRGRPTGVVDWPNACRGPWGCDVAHCRANLIDLSGDGAADAFLAAYERQTGATFHPYWEIASVMEHGPSHWTGANVATAERRLRRALARL